MQWRWIRNTAGKPDSQLTMQTMWNLLGMLLVVIVVARSVFAGGTVDDGVWWFVGAMAGVTTTGYVSRRGVGGVVKDGVVKEPITSAEMPSEDLDELSASPPKRTLKG